MRRLQANEGPSLHTELVDVLAVCLALRFPHRGLLELTRCHVLCPSLCLQLEGGLAEKKLIIQMQSLCSNFLSGEQNVRWTRSMD